MHKAGFVNIVGNPNVGKSTLMNLLVGERISITTFKAQTTRHRIMGILNTPEMQICFSDTPGVLKPNYKLQEHMLKFSESALQLALGADPSLWKWAYDSGVIIAGSQSLFIMLRVLEMSWKQMRQVENQQEMMKVASQVVERVQIFYERFLKVDEQLRKTNEAFDELKRSTSSSGVSITTAAAKLLKYGAQENPKRRQRLPKPVEETEELTEE